MTARRPKSSHSRSPESSRSNGASSPEPTPAGDPDFPMPACQPTLAPGVEPTALAGRLATLPCTFGRYQLLEQLGQGGMGTVYLAHDPLLERRIALKVPHPDVLRSPAA